MLTFEHLRYILIRVLDELDIPNHDRPDPQSDKGKLLYRHFIHDYILLSDGYELTIYPRGHQDETGYMFVGWKNSIKAGRDNSYDLTFRVAAHSANTTYEMRYTYPYTVERLEMRQAPGINVTADNERFKQVYCFDPLVLDVIELMSPPYWDEFRPPVDPKSWGVDTKRCILCTLPILNNRIVCLDCDPRQPGARTQP